MVVVRVDHMVVSWVESWDIQWVHAKVVELAEKSDSMMVDYWAETMDDLMADDLVDL